MDIRMDVNVNGNAKVSVFIWMGVYAKFDFLILMLNWSLSLMSSWVGRWW